MKLMGKSHQAKVKKEKKELKMEGDRKMAESKMLVYELN